MYLKKNKDTTPKANRRKKITIRNSEIENRKTVEKMSRNKS